MANTRDWRVTVSLPDLSQAAHARRTFAVHKVEADMRGRLGGRVVIGAGDQGVFLYAGSENAARQAQEVAREVLASEGIEAEFSLDRWHPIAQGWESADISMPTTEAEREAEHQRLEETENAESLASGEAQWEARAEFPSHHEAVAMERQLRAEGRTVIRRWKFLVVGANNEDDAQELAEHIRSEAPADATVIVEAAGLRLPFIPF